MTTTSLIDRISIINKLKTISGFIESFQGDQVLSNLGWYDVKI